jgi:hypothetical protein
MNKGKRKKNDLMKLKKKKQKGQTKNKNCVTSTASLRINHLENKVPSVINLDPQVATL